MCAASAASNLISKSADKGRHGQRITRGRDRARRVFFFASPTPMGGKIKAAKPPGSKPRKGDSNGFSWKMLLGSLLVVGIAYVAYDVGTGTAPSSSNGAAGTTKGRQGRDASKSGRKERELTAHELRQQGRKVPGSERARCVDGRGCASVTAEQCTNDAQVRSKCCLSSEDCKHHKAKSRSNCTHQSASCCGPSTSASGV